MDTNTIPKKLIRPKPGQQAVVTVDRADPVLVLDFSLEAVTLVRDGETLIFVFADGAAIRLPGLLAPGTPRPLALLPDGSTVAIDAGGVPPASSNSTGTLSWPGDDRLGWHTRSPGPSVIEDVPLPLDIDHASDPYDPYSSSRPYPDATTTLWPDMGELAPQPPPEPEIQHIALALMDEGDVAIPGPVREVADTTPTDRCVDPDGTE